eukprot:CAMPEP_0183353480 /NCGR_PEP_ID=MMETSP0164_2-20130417/33279_1 /TAXON_ID=221442 /ORGANISM="Coccolithus pelagicus ssp braarudi, Strain PLY182g" /LENGTH=117 /DNA_ID=CAMNT_0025526155 /DNA_START=602 /DNA_END=955 /DNA_ORIENTATION=-
MTLTFATSPPLVNGSASTLHLEEATRFLENRVAAIGFTNALPALVNWLRRHWPHVFNGSGCTLPTFNINTSPSYRTTASSELPASLREYLTKANALDLLLWQRATGMSNAIKRSGPH